MNNELVGRKRKIESILNHRVEGEGFITTSSRIWKPIVIKNFNRIYRKEINVNELIGILRSNGVIFEQKDHLIKYPVKECLRYIAKVSKKEIEL